MKNIVIILSVFLIFFSCQNQNSQLPVLGNTVISGKDTIYHTIPAFEFISQDSLRITNKSFDDKIYVADFIFLSCPSICPAMTGEMFKVYEEFRANPNVLFLSHTIDPLRDSIPRLKSYADNMGVDNKKWFFVTGNKDSIYAIAEKGYFATTAADSTSPGGYAHSGGLLLIDKHKRIRGVYDGTNPKETVRLMSDLKILLNEQF